MKKIQKTKQKTSRLTDVELWEVRYVLERLISSMELDKELDCYFGDGTFISSMDPVALDRIRSAHRKLRDEYMVRRTTGIY